MREDRRVRAKRNDARMQMHEDAIVKPVTLDANMERNKKSKSNWDDIQKGRLPGVLERSLTAMQGGSLLSSLGAVGSLTRSEPCILYSIRKCILKSYRPRVGLRGALLETVGWHFGDI